MRAVTPLSRAMTAFLEHNQDYLLFITGLAFAQAGLVAHALSRVEHQPAWRWFGWFALVRAFASWLAMVRLLDLGISDLLATIGTLAQGVSTLLLLEFARSLTAIRHNGRPGRWIHLLLLTCAGAASTILPHDALTSVHFVLTPIAGLWASYTLWLLQQNTAARAERRRWKSAAAVLIVATTGLSAAALFDQTPAISSIVLANTALACLIAISLGWCYSIRAQNTLATGRIPGWRNRRAVWLLAAISIIAVGWIAAETVGLRRDRAMRRDALARCQLVAATVPPALAHSLDWGESDLGKPAYQELKARMISLVKANHDLRFVLLAGVLDNQCYFIVDSEPPESDDYSPPGQLYTEASADYVARMASREPFVLGPVRDRWGTWIIASVPILAPASDRGSINAEIDISAGDWHSAILRERLPVAVIVLLILSLLLLAFHAQERIREQMDNLALSEQRNTTLIEGSPNCIQMLDLDGRCLTVNHRGLVALGCPASTVIGRPFVELWPAPVRPLVASALRETALGKPVDFEADYFRPDGRQIIWRVTTNPVRDTGNRIRSFVCICTDITESKNTERTLLAAKEAAEAADRAKSEFLAVMSHEIRTPLGGVIGMLEILRRQNQSTDQRRYTDMAHGSAEALLEILDDILDAAKVQSGRLHLETIAFRVQDEFLRVLEVMKLRAEAKKISLDWTFDPALPPALLGDPTRLRQVLANLLSNAIKFTATGGITVAFSRAAEIGEKISLSIKVSDTGIGISPEARATLFGKFVQADASTTRSYGGTGLGLSIVKGLIEQMGGSISVESTPGKGTTFSGQIPLAVASENQLAELTVSSGDTTYFPPHARSLRLLCAEDDAVQRAIAESQAQEMGHTITFAVNGAEALEKLRHADFDAVLMDNRMPVMDGFQATRAIRAGDNGVRQPLIPIIAITANASIAYRDECLAAGMNDFLTKPLRRADFHRALADVIHASFAASDDETIVPDGLTEAELLAMLDESPASRRSEEPVSAKIATLFFEETSGRFAEMQAALKNKDTRTFARAAHSVKSTSLYIHARQLSEIAAQLEKFADAGQFESLPAPLAQAEALFAELLARHQRAGSKSPFSAT
jgi:PAS domain S-box-containing protein